MARNFYTTTFTAPQDAYGQANGTTKAQQKAQATPGIIIIILVLVWLFGFLVG